MIVESVTAVLTLSGHTRDYSHFPVSQSQFGLPPCDGRLNISTAQLFVLHNMLRSLAPGTFLNNTT